jgi:hypothetical protein
VVSCFYGYFIQHLLQQIRTKGLRKCLHEFPFMLQVINSSD